MPGQGEVRAERREVAGDVSQNVIRGEGRTTFAAASACVCVLQVYTSIQAAEQASVNRRVTETCQTRFSFLKCFLRRVSALNPQAASARGRPRGCSL